MSSHREAPEISKHPVADSTDLYAFVSPNPASPTPSRSSPTTSRWRHPTAARTSTSSATRCSTRSISTTPATGSPTSATSSGSRRSTTSRHRSSTTTGRSPSLTPPSPTSTWNRQQTYTLHPRRPQPAQSLAEARRCVARVRVCCARPATSDRCPPRTTPALASPAVHTVGTGPFSAKVFAGQRAEGFYVDLGAVFDLGDLRGFAGDHAGGPAAGLMNGMPGVNSTADVNVHSLALQIPTSSSPGPPRPVQPTRPRSSACGPPPAASGCGSGPTADRNGTSLRSGPVDPGLAAGQSADQRAAHRHRRQEPLEPLPPLSDGQQFLPLLRHAAAGRSCCRRLYPGVFPNLAAYNSVHGQHPARHRGHLPDRDPGRRDHPGPDFTNYNGTGVKADLLRLNTAIPPASSPNSLGLLGRDVAGYPNGRRVFDDVATIALRAVAGATLGFVVPSFTPDGAAGVVDFGLTGGRNRSHGQGHGELPDAHSRTWGPRTAASRIPRQAPVSVAP